MSLCINESKGGRAGVMGVLRRILRLVLCNTRKCLLRHRTYCTRLCIVAEGDMEQGSLGGRGFCSVACGGRVGSDLCAVDGNELVGGGPVGDA